MMQRLLAVATQRAALLNGVQGSLTSFAGSATLDPVSGALQTCEYRRRASLLRLEFKA
ncbi:MAG: hypothetical protein AAF645_02975 [Myxococcota bacterium]